MSSNSSSYVHVLTEMVVVGLMTAFIGSVISYLFMGKEAKEFKHWKSVWGSLFVTGVLIHFLCEVLGINKWYCKNGRACVDV